MYDAMTEADATRIIASSFPAVWSDLWAKRETPGAFHDSGWSRPRTYFRDPAALEQAAPGLTGMCPLFERNGEAIVGWLPASDRFVEFYYEDGRDGDAAIQVLGLNYQQFLLSLCLELEDAGMRDEWMELADAAQFKHATELAAVLDSEPFDERAIDALRERLAR
jgi:hypothetical protein